MQLEDEKLDLSRQQSDEEDSLGELEEDIARMAIREQVERCVHLVVAADSSQGADEGQEMSIANGDGKDRSHFPIAVAPVTAEDQSIPDESAKRPVDDRHPESSRGSRLRQMATSLVQEDVGSTDGGDGDDAIGPASVGPSKREKRRAKEAKKKLEEEEQRREMKDARKSKGAASRTDLTPDKTDTKAVYPPKQKKQFAKDKRKEEEEVVTEETLQRAIDSIEEKCQKLKDRWETELSGESAAMPLLTIALLERLSTIKHILCLGLGRPYEDRTAQIQLALMLLLARSLNVRRRLRSGLISDLYGGIRPSMEAKRPRCTGSLWHKYSGRESCESSLIHAQSQLISRWGATSFPMIGLP